MCMMTEGLQWDIGKTLGFPGVMRRLNVELQKSVLALIYKPVTSCGIRQSLLGLSGEYVYLGNACISTCSTRR